MDQTNKTTREPHFFQQNNLHQYGMEAAPCSNNTNSATNDLKHEQMLKLIAKGFYKELIRYGIDKKDVIKVSTHLLDHLIEGKEHLQENKEYYNRYFSLKNIKDEWNSHKRLAIDDLSISPLHFDMYAQVAIWLRNPSIKYSFITLFPDTESALKKYFEQSTRDYFGIFYKNDPVGVIGADHTDESSRKLEMRKFVGDTSLQGKGIGKRATFLFLYYSFVILNFNKVYIYSRNTNIRNINLNSKFGFELEGVLFEDVALRNKKQDVVRMGLLRSRWLNIFSHI